MKKLLIVLGCISGVVFIFILVAIVFIIVKFPEYKQQKEDKQNQVVIDYFCNLYEEDIYEIEVTGAASVGTGNPVPFAGSDSNDIYEYKLSIDGKYRATVWVDWKNESFSLKNSDFPGKLKEHE